MNVLVLTPALYDTAPGQRFRIEQWARYLARDGLRFDFVPFEDEALHRVLYTRGRYVRKTLLMLRAFIRRLAALTTIRKYDLVFLPREAAMIGPALIERLIAALGVPVVYDFDDPIWLAYRSPANGLLSRLRWRAKTATICRLASRVIVGNRLLADWARQHASKVDVVPSTIDLARYPPKLPERATGPVTLGWTGSHSTLPFLAMLHDTLTRLAARHTFRLLVISHRDDYPLESAPFEVVAKRWNATTEATDLHEIDIGLGPFPNSGWTPWRCHGKVLQYMAAGIPCVASRIGILPEYIRDGENGLLAADPSQWLERLSLLIDDADLRRRIGLAGRDTIERRYSVDAWLPKVRRILESAVDTFSPGKRPKLSQGERVPVPLEPNRGAKCRC